MFTSAIKSMTSTVPTDVYARPFVPFAHLSTESQQQPSPIYVVSQYSPNFDKPLANMIGFSRILGLDKPDSFGNIFKCVPMQSFKYHIPSLENPSAIMVIPPPSTKSPALRTTVETKYSQEVSPNFCVQNSLFMPQASESKHKYLNSFLNPNLDSSNNIGCLSNPTWAKPILNEPQNPVTRQCAYRCEPCGMEFQTPQAFGGHMSYHSKVRKAKAMEQQTVLPKSKKPKIEPATHSPEKRMMPEMDARMKVNSIKAGKAKKPSEEVANKYALMQ